MTRLLAPSRIIENVAGPVDDHCVGYSYPGADGRRGCSRLQTIVEVEARRQFRLVARKSAS